ncbi:MAG: tRNA uracil 4-sulfurtransferase ThiI, partial [Candidatus Micrarchaeia archaeon]
LLMRNIRSALDGLGTASIVRQPGRILISSESMDSGQAAHALSRVFGIDHISVCTETEPDIDKILALVSSLSEGLKGSSIRVETKRADKSFHLKSQEVSARAGSVLTRAGCSVDLTNPQKTVHIDILEGRALVSLGRERCPGGLPVGSSGRLLSLFSGGIDSPVASWLMMRRGCSVDLLHVHQLRENKEVMDSKISRLARTIRSYSPKDIRLYVAPYEPFYRRSLAYDSRRELVVFRRFLFHLANSIVEKHGYQGVITGDSVGQVASQTLQNILASDEAARYPVYRPLAGFNKQEITDISVRIGAFDDSITPYKDCCSLVSGKSPSTSAPLSAVKSIESGMGMDRIVQETLERMEIFEINPKGASSLS